MSINFERAHYLATDLAGTKVDRNEVAKTLAYLRAQKNGREVFAYLQAINTKAGACVVSRSNQTPEYYREMLSAFEHHLRPLQDNYQEMAETLGWAIRLFRYYREVPEYQPDYNAQTEKRGTTSKSQKIPPPVGPEVGDVVTGQIVGPYDDRSYQVTINKAAQNVIGVLPKNYGRTNGGIRAEVTRVVKREGQVYALLKPVKRAKE